MATSTALGYSPPFSIGSGFEGGVSVNINAISIQSDGKILAGGGFTTFSGSSQNRLVRLDSNGSADTSFNIGTGFNSSISAMVIQSDGKILAGGGFTTFSGSSQNRLVRLDSNGSRDTSFNIGTGFNTTEVRSISIQSDGKILVGGSFTTFTGSSQNYLIRLNSNGSKDTSFNIGVGFNEAVLATAIQSDGKILVGGGFTTFTGSSQNYLIRLNSDGSKDTSFNIGTGFNDYVFATVIQSDGKILAAGRFGTFSGTSSSGLIRLNSDGSRDTSFNIGTGFDGGTVSCLAIQSDGKILAGGFFTTFTGVSQNYLVRLNSDGSEDTSLNIGIGFNNLTNVITIESNEKIFVGGSFTTYKSSSQNRLVRLNSIGDISTGTTITGTQQIGNLLVATASTVNYSPSTNGGVTFWMGPDEELGYVIGVPVSGGTQTTPIGGVNAFLGFYRSASLTEPSFLSIVNSTFNQSLTTGSAAKTYLNNNGYWTSWTGGTVTNGLVLNLDSGNSTSYPGTGTTWFDLTSNGNNANLTSATFTANTINFTRASNTRAITISSLNLSTTPTITINIWVKFKSLPTGGGDSIRIISELSDNYNSFSDSFWFGTVIEAGSIRWFTQDKGNVGYNAKYLTTPLPAIDTWYNFTVIYDHTQTASNERTFYINAVNQTSIASTEGGTTYNSDNTNNFGNRPLYIGGRSTASFSSDMYLPVFQIYNRALTATEVTQNFDALRLRYGL
jgi:uncharacterized delta-60 repeat protein